MSAVTGRRLVVLRASGALALLLALAAGIPGLRGAGVGARWRSLRDRVQRLEARYHVHRGHEALRRGHDRLAVREYQAAMASDPAQEEPSLHLADVYKRLADSAAPRDPLRREQLRRAALCLHRAIEGGGAPTPALRRLVQLYGPDGLDTPAGMEWALRRILQTGESLPDESLALAHLYDRAGMDREAEATLLAARRAHPDAGAVHRRLATFYRRREDRRAALAVLESWLARNPDDREGALALVMGLWDLAARDHEAAAETRTRHVRDALGILDRLLATGPPEPALLLYRSVFLRLAAAGAEPGKRRDELLAEADALRQRGRQLSRPAPPQPPPGSGAP